MWHLIITKQKEVLIARWVSDYPRDGKLAYKDLFDCYCNVCMCNISEIIPLN